MCFSFCADCVSFAEKWTSWLPVICWIINTPYGMSSLSRCTEFRSKTQSWWYFSNNRNYAEHRCWRLWRVKREVEVLLYFFQFWLSRTARQLRWLLLNIIRCHFLVIMHLCHAHVINDFYAFAYPLCLSLHQRRTDLSISDSPSFMSGTSSIGSID